MHWDAKSAKLIIQNPENENQTVSWPSTVDLWNYNGNSWTYDLPTGDKFAFSKRIDVNIATTEGAGSTVRGISVTDTVGAANAIHEGIISHVTSAYMTGSWCNAVVGAITYSATGSAGGGMAAPICSELNMQPAASSGGSYYNYHSYFSVPTDAELIDSTAFNYAFERYELADNASYDFGLYGLLWHVVGLYDHSGKVWYDNTLKIQIDTTKWWIPLSEAEGSYTTSYPISSTSTIKYGVSGTGMTISSGEDYVSEFFSSSDTGAQAYNTNVGTMYARHDIDAGCELDSNSYVSSGFFRMEIAGVATDLSAVNGPWITALMGYVKNPSGSVDANSNIVSAVNGLVNVGADYFSNAPAALYTCAFVAASYTNAGADISNYPAYLVYDLGSQEFTHGLWVGASSATTAVGMGTVTNAFEFPAEATAPVEAHVADENSTGRIKILVDDATRYIYYYD